MSEGPPTDATPPGAADAATGEPATTVVPRPGSHRAERSAYAVVVPVLVVAVALVAVGVGVYGWLTVGDSPEALPGVIPAVSTPSGQPSASTPSQTAEPSTSPSPSDSPEPSESPEPTPTPSPTPSATPKPSPTPTKSAAPVTRDTPVIVLNQTSITGLAATTARQLERKGWTVTGTGNWRGDVPETTVYYPAGQAAEANQLARDLGADRVRPRADGMRKDRLTVILNSRPS